MSADYFRTRDKVYSMRKPSGGTLETGNNLSGNHVQSDDSIPQEASALPTKAIMHDYATLNNKQTLQKCLDDNALCPSLANNTGASADRRHCRPSVLVDQ